MVFIVRIAIVDSRFLINSYAVSIISFHFDRLSYRFQVCTFLVGFESGVLWNNGLLFGIVVFII